MRSLSTATILIISSLLGAMSWTASSAGITPAGRGHAVGPQRPVAPSARCQATDVVSARSEDVELIGTWGAGICWGFALNGSDGYMASGHALQRLDLADPANPVFVDEVLLPDVALDIEVDDGTAYVANFSSGLGVVDVSGPGAPTEIGRLELRGSTAEVALYSNYAYVANTSIGLVIVDILDPGNPALADSIVLDGAFNVEIQETHAFVLAQDGLHIFDISTPLTPVEVCSLPYTPIEDEMGALTVLGDYAYVMHAGGLQVIDISTPGSCVERGSIDGLEFVGFDIRADAGYLYYTNWDFFCVLDVSNPDNPTPVEYYDLGDTGYHHAGAIHLDGATAYLTDSYIGLKVLDVTDPGNVIELGQYNIVGYIDLLAWRGDVVAAAGIPGIWLFDVSIPSDPDTFASVPMPPSGNLNDLERLAIAGNHLFLLFDHSLAAVDISTPSDPQSADELVTGWLDNEDMVVCEDRDVAIIGAENQLLLVNTSNPGFLVPAGTVNLCGGVWSLAIDDQCEYLYVVTWTELYVYSVDALVDKRGHVDPCGLWTLGAHTSLIEDLVVDSDRDLAYLAEEDGLIRIFDIADPCDPDSVGAYTVPAEIEGLAVCQGAGGEPVLMVLHKENDAYSRLYVLDVSDPAMPTEVGSYDDIVEAEELAVQGNMVIVTLGTHGFVILAADACTPVLLRRFSAERQGRDVLLQWELGYESLDGGFHVYREGVGTGRVRLTEIPIGWGREFQFMDLSAPACELSYWLERIELGGERSWVGSAQVAAEVSLSGRSSLERIHPNPFHAQTSIDFRLTRSCPVILAIYDVAGRQVTTLMDGTMPADEYSVNWNGRDAAGRDMPSGVYLARLNAGGVILDAKVLLSR
ncbi:MAG: hypothetical protein KAY32_06570 [Candidatus Eisenbacteria sp.]|nr:hypothetical protein [Candidatus Eisenbacteria bacterium]